MFAFKHSEVIMHYGVQKDTTMSGVMKVRNGTH